MAKKYIDADLLRKEIEKRKNICEGVFERDSDTYYQGKTVAYQETLSLIDSLQQEQPCDTCTNDKGCVTCKDGELWEGKEQPSEDLEAEIDRWFGEQYMQNMEGLPIKPIVQIIARHFAEWQKSKMPMPEDTVIFQKGIEEGKRLMMEDAVEAEVHYFGETQGVPRSITIPRMQEWLKPFKDGDKVKIVIVPIKEENK